MLGYTLVGVLRRNGGLLEAGKASLAAIDVGLPLAESYEKVSAPLVVESGHHLDELWEKMAASMAALEAGMESPQWWVQGQPLGSSV
jgi:hypothetical protein